MDETYHLTLAEVFNVISFYLFMQSIYPKMTKKQFAVNVYNMWTGVWLQFSLFYSANIFNIILPTD